MISIKSVDKKFGDHWAVQALNLEVQKGCVFGLLGQNGSGKSTTIGIVLGQVFPSAGTVCVNGHNVFKDRRRALARVGAIFETPVFYPYLSGRTNLRIFCQYTTIHDPQRIEEVVRFVKLTDVIHNRVGTYSHGMRQRLAVAQALLPDPELLILDEPMDGLDPEGVYEMRHLIRQLNEQKGLTIMLSAHVLSEVQQLCSNVAVLKQGRMIFCGQWRQSNFEQPWVRVDADNQMAAEAGLINAGLITHFTGKGRGQLIAGRSVADVADWLARHEFRVRALVPIEKTLEDFYLETVRAAPGEENHTAPVDFKKEHDA